MDSPRPDSDRKPTSGPGPSDQKPDGEERRPPYPFPWLLVALLGVILVFFLFNDSPESIGSKVDYSFFRSQLEADNVESVIFYGEVLTGKWKKPPQDPEDEKKVLEPEFNTVLPLPAIQNDSITKELELRKVKQSAEKREIGGGQQLLLYMIGPLLIIGFFWFMMRRSAESMGPGGMLGSYTRSPAKKFQADSKRTTFDDVAGMEQAKRELMEVVEFLKEPEKFQKLGATIPKGVLLMGAPGTGKTLMARATAGEAGVPFYSINGSEFIQMFVGVGASRVRDLFQTAKQSAPSILFIDEIDAVGRVRGAGVGGGHDEREQTLNQILSEMDGFEQTEAVIVIAATNRPDVLDPALLRPGRFDRHITVDRPTKKGRVGILKVHSRHVPLDADVDLEEIAGGTIGFSGADLKNLVNEAALNATRRNANRVTRDDFEIARDRVLMGPVREESMNEKERRMTAGHEAGHALIAWLLEELDPLHKVTIVPRGRALGVTQLLPDEERYSVGEKKLHSQLTMMLGGRAAEKLLFDEYTAGAEDDLKRATAIARRMVAYWGMSETIGPVAFRQGEEHPFLGKEMHEHRQFSEETARIIDKEVQRFLEEASDRATEILKKHRDKLDLLTETLLKEESLDSEAVTKIIGRSAHAEMLERERASSGRAAKSDDSNTKSDTAAKQAEQADPV